MVSVLVKRSFSEEGCVTLLLYLEVLKRTQYFPIKVRSTSNGPEN